MNKIKFTLITVTLIGVVVVSYAIVKKLENQNSTEETREFNSPLTCRMLCDEYLALVSLNLWEENKSTYKSISGDVKEVAIKRSEIERLERVKKEKERLEKIERVRQENLRKEKERKLIEEKKREKEISISRGSDYKGVNEQLGIFNVSWYGSDCKGCSGQTASGVWVDKSIYYKGYGVAASDWNVIPPYSIIEVENYGRYIILDKGGAITGKKLDLLTTSEAKSYDYGRQHLNVTVLRWGKK